MKLGNEASLDSHGATGPVPWQRRPCLIVTSGALSVLNPSELQVWCTDGISITLPQRSSVAIC